MADEYYLRPRFHPSAPTGRVKAPAAMVLDHGTLHSFYLNDPVYPFGASPVSWGHASAEIEGDLDYPVHYLAESLTPGAPYDAAGCGAGTFSKDREGNVQFAFYGGKAIVKGANGEKRPQYTINRINAGLLNFPCGGTYIRDSANPVISNEKFPELAEIAPFGVSDPMISWNTTAESEEDYQSRLITIPAEVGGMPILFGSNDKIDWTLPGQLTVDTSEARLGGSPLILPDVQDWQRVSLFTVHDLITDSHDDLLIFTVEGLDPVTDEHGIEHFKNNLTCGYLVGKLVGTEFHVARGFTELDFGLNFYYPRTCAESTRDGVTESTILQGLIAQADHRIGKSLDGMVWRNSLSIPRRLLLEDGQLSQHFIFPYNSEEVHETDPFGKRVFHTEELGSHAKNFHVVDESGAKMVTFEYRPGEVSTVKMINGDEQRVAPCGEGPCHLIVDGTAIDASFADGLTVFSFAAVPTHGYHWDHIEVEDLD